MDEDFHCSSHEQLDISHLQDTDIFNEGFSNQEKKILATQESIEAFNVIENALFDSFGLKEEKVLFALFELKNDLSSQINAAAEQQTKSRIYQKNYRDKIRVAKELFTNYDPAFFKEWKNEISQSVSFDTHAKKIMIHNEEKLRKDYPDDFERLSIKRNLISFCKQQIYKKKA